MSKISSGTVHKLTQAFKDILSHNDKLLFIWESLTPLARNEWLCYLSSPKKEETKIIRLKKAKSKLLAGMRRPCCFAGCPHR